MHLLCCRLTRRGPLRCRLNSLLLEKDVFLLFTEPKKLDLLLGYCECHENNCFLKYVKFHSMLYTFDHEGRVFYIIGSYLDKLFFMMWPKF